MTAGCTRIARPDIVASPAWRVPFLVVLVIAIAACGMAAAQGRTFAAKHALQNRAAAASVLVERKGAQTQALVPSGDSLPDLTAGPGAMAAPLPSFGTQPRLLPGTPDAARGTTASAFNPRAPPEERPA